MGQGKYFEEFEIGDTFVTPRRTITETDLIQFAGMSGDFNPIHTDHVYAADSPYGQPVVYGLLVLSVVTGLTARLGIFDGTIIAMLGIDDWKFSGPVFVGDTIHVRMTIISKRETSRPDRGIMVRGYEVLNQRDEVVQTGSMTLMIRRQEQVDA
jgi:acyl dehydratase